MLQALQQSLDRITIAILNINERLARQETTLATLQKGVPQGVPKRIPTLCLAY